MLSEPDSSLDLVTRAVSTRASWSGAKYRCHNKNVHEKDPETWARYGGRGIKMCDRWRYSFENFLNDMGIKPTIGLELDRWPNQDGNYEPGNCRWATGKENSQNRSSSIDITWQGITKNASEWARDFELGLSTFHARFKAGMTMEQIRDIPVLGTSKERGRNKRNAVMLTHNGKTQSMSAWAEELDIKLATLWQRKKMGWSDEDIITKPCVAKSPEVLLTHNGKTQNQEAWAKELGLSGNAIHQRRKLGLPIEQVLATDSLLKGGVGELFEFRGEQKTVVEIAKELNLHKSLVYSRIRDGIKPDDMQPRKANYEREIKLTYNGKTQNISQWSKELGITTAKIRWGLSQKWSLDTILNKE